MSSPLTAELLAELQPVLASMVREAVRSIAPSIVVPPTLLPATVLTSSRDGTAQVQPDGSTTTPITAQTLVGMPAIGARVMLEFCDPSGIFIVGYCGGSDLDIGRVGGQWTRAAAQSIPSGVLTSLQLDTMIEDTDAFLQVLPGIAPTVPTTVPGLYVAWGQVTFAAAVGAARAFCQINTNLGGTEFARTPIGVGAENACSACGLFDMTGASTFTLDAFQSTGAPVNATGRLHVYRLIPF